LNVAVADVAAVTSTVHVDVPLQAPDHPANAEPDSGVAVSFTDVPLRKPATQVVPQSMPVGLLVMVPAPVPALCKAIRIGGFVKLNVAVTESLAIRVTVHVAVPLQADHPANVAPDSGVAVSFTDVPLGNSALHTVGQLMPEGLLVTVPVPAPAVFKVSVKVVAKAEWAEAQMQNMHKTPRHRRLATHQRL
jgi:hypothetical protein